MAPPPPCYSSCLPFLSGSARLLCWLRVPSTRERDISPLLDSFMPAIHLVPWCIALVERRNIRKLLSLMPQDEFLIHRAVKRVLWSGYVTLAVVEYWLY